MRAKQFLQYLKDGQYDPSKAATLAQCKQIAGGWESWLQVELASVFVSQNDSNVCEREAVYPSGSSGVNKWVIKNTAAHSVYTAGSKKSDGVRCDFYLHRRDFSGLTDDTYVELKCINPSRANPLQDAWIRFGKDIEKIENITKVNPTVNGVAVLATFGTFSDPSSIFSSRMQAYVWDTENGNVTAFEKVKTGGANRFFIIAVSV